MLGRVDEVQPPNIVPRLDRREGFVERSFRVRI